MFIDGIELIQADQFLALPTWKSLQGNEELLRIGSGRFYSVTQGFIVNPILSAGGEIEVSALCTAVQPDQFPCRVIEGRPQVVNGIPDQYRERGWYRLVEAHLDGIEVTLRVIANAKRIAVTLFPFSKNMLHIRDVLIGPLDLL